MNVKYASKNKAETKYKRMLGMFGGTAPTLSDFTVVFNGSGFQEVFLCPPFPRHARYLGTFFYLASVFRNFPKVPLSENYLILRPSRFSSLLSIGDS